MSSERLDCASGEGRSGKGRLAQATGDAAVQFGQQRFDKLGRAVLKQYDSLTDLLSMFADDEKVIYGEERRVVWLRENNYEVNSSRSRSSQTCASPKRVMKNPARKRGVSLIKHGLHTRMAYEQLQKLAITVTVRREQQQFGAMRISHYLVGSMYILSNPTPGIRAGLNVGFVLVK